jgi:hypothetical protein
MKLIKIGANGKPLPKGSRAKAVAFLDKERGLMWPAQDLAGRHMWSDAKKAASALDLAGASDWRLPTIDELETLRDRSRFSPAADPILNLQSDWYWSSTPVASAPSDFAWLVHFYYGNSGDHVQCLQGLVRPVRSVSARQ